MTRSLSFIAARGAAVLSANTVLAKVVALIGQVVLARLLVPEAWGIFSLAIAAAGFASLVGQFGLVQVLVHRRDELDQIEPSAFWLSVSCGAVASVGLVALAPLWAFAMNDQRVIPVIHVLSIDVFLGALAIAPIARLRSRMRFGALALVGAASSIAQMGMSVLFASFGFGEMALAIPKPIAALFQLFMFWRLAECGLPRGLALNQVLSLFKAGGPVMVAGLAFAITQDGDKVILGRLTSVHAVGLYAFAFGLSTQITSLIAQNVQAALLPALSISKHDQKLQFRQAQRASRLLAIIVFPVCCAIAVSGDSIILLVFGKRWLEAAPLLRILSLAAAFRVLAGPPAVLLLASGRFLRYVSLHVLSAFVFLLIVASAAFVMGPLGAALGVLVHSVIAVAIFSGSWRQNEMPATTFSGLGIMAPILASFIAVVAVVIVGESVVAGQRLTGWFGDCLRIGSTFVVGGAVYAIIILLIAKQDALDLIAVVRSVATRFRVSTS